MTIVLVRSRSRRLRGAWILVLALALLCAKVTTAAAVTSVGKAIAIDPATLQPLPVATLAVIAGTEQHRTALATQLDRWIAGLAGASGVAAGPRPDEVTAHAIPTLRTAVETG